jgi:hypothetical protein
MIPKKVTFIYGLIDPTTLDVRYIGKSNNPYKRLYGRGGHLNPKAASHTHKACWIRSLLRQNLQPTCCILEQCENIKAIYDAREINWIAFGRQIGWLLTNATDGGDGSQLGQISDSGRRAIIESNKRRRGEHHSEKTKIKISTALKGIRRSKKTREKISEVAKLRVGPKNSMFGKHHSTKTREKISESICENHQNEYERQLIREKKRID